MELVEATFKDGLTGETVTDTYEIYEGDWVQLITTSANPYWHTVDVWKEKFPEYTEPIKTAKIMVLSTGRAVGYWEEKKDFYEFLRLWMRAEINEVVFA